MYKCMEDSVVGFAEDMPISEDQMDSDVAHDEGETKRPVIKTSPEVSLKFIIILRNAWNG